MVKISVIMSVYNTKERWLRESIESILAQTYSNLEFIIILDRPTDDSCRIVKEYEQRDSRIIVLNNPENLGLTKSLNLGLKNAKGEYIARMDSDDVSVSTRFEKQVEYLEKNEDVAVVGSLVNVFDEDGNHSIGMNNNCRDFETNRIKMMFCNAGVAHSTAMIRKKFLDDNQLNYDKSMKKAQDYGLWTDIIINNGKIDVINEILLDYRCHSNQITQMCSDEQIKCIKNNMYKQIKYYLDYELSQDEMDINFKLFRDFTSLSKKETEIYLNKLLRLSKMSDKINTKKFFREIYAMWLYGTLKTIKTKKDFEFFLSKITFLSLRPSYILYAIQKKKSDKKYKYILKRYLKKIKKEREFYEK